ncbi:EGF-like domain-containing protein, partial [Nephila pilipes]
PCSGSPCLNGGICRVERDSFQCDCPTPYSGNKCEKDPCSDNPCLNGGICRVEKDSFQCDCPTPYSGNKCEKDPCSGNPCLNGGTCRVERNSFQCYCPSSYSGNTCEKECHCGTHSKTCKYGLFGKTCECEDGYSDRNGFCTGICNPDKCLHGKCEVVDLDYKCRCDEGYAGHRCEENVKTKLNDLVLLMATFISVFTFMCILLFGILCILCRKRK